MKETSNLPVITKSSNGLTNYLREVNNIPCLSAEEEFLLAKNYLEHQDIDAAHKLVKSHLKLVAKIAMRYKNYGLPVNDLISEGNIGLMKAVKKYDPDLGHRLSTYSMWWIKASIQEYVLRSWSLVKIGTTSAQKKLFFSLNKVKKKIAALYSRPVNETDHDQIAQELGVSTKEVSEMNMRLSGTDSSLNRTVGYSDDSKTEMIDLLPEAKANQEDILSCKQIASNHKKILFDAISQLNEREMKILTARKLNDAPVTLDVLSTEYNISKERVRQIENRAFEKVQLYVLEKINTDGQLKTIESN